MKLPLRILMAVPLLAAPLASAQSLNLISKNSVWKFLDNGSDQGASNIVVGHPSYNANHWKHPDFNSTGWGSGNGELGFGDGGEATPMQKGPVGNQYRTFYFRYEFTLTASQLNTLGTEGYLLAFELLRDDGAIVYINGQEMFRDAMAAGTANYLTLANQTAGGATESTYFAHSAIGTGLLVAEPAKNVIAVEVHQATAGSSDVSFDMAAEAVVVPNTFGAFHPPQCITFEESDEGDLDFMPNLLRNDDLGWIGTSLAGNGGPPGVSWYDNFHTGLPGFGSKEDGFTEGGCFLVGGFSGLGGGRLTSQLPGLNPLKYRIDLRNYTNVKVSFGIRVYDGGFPDDPDDDGIGFGNEDYIRFWHHTSTDGSTFTKLGGNGLPTGTPDFELRGGGSAAGGTVVLVPENQPKKAFVPTTDIGTTWRNLSYNDAGWLSGNGGVGYERSSSNTYDPYFLATGINVEAGMYQRMESCYIRIPFNVADKSEFTGLTLGVRFDDGYVAFLNGVQVHSENPPGSLLWNSGASTTHADGAAVNLQYVNLPGTALTNLNAGAGSAGDNILAIHGLNRGTGSSDFLVSPVLEARTAGTANRQDPPQNLIDINRGLDGGFYQVETKPHPTLPGQTLYANMTLPDSVNSYTFTYEARCDDYPELIMFDNFKITGDPIEIDSYPAYISINHPSLDPDEDGLDNADPDCDGIINYLEYAFCGDAEVASQTDPYGAPLLPQVRTVEDGGSTFLEMSWRQLNEPSEGSLLSPFGGYSLLDIKYIPQWSTDGVNWNDAATGADSFLQIGEAEVNQDDGGKTVLVTARFINAIPLTDTGSGDFLPLLVRVKVEGYKLILE